MLYSFFIQNFRSILELKLNLAYGEGKAPNGYQDQAIMPFIEAGNKTRIVPCMAFYGANASGKTNVIKAIYALQELVGEAGSLVKYYDPNMLNQKSIHTTFAVEFVIENALFEYRIQYNAEEIIEECLAKDHKPIYTIRAMKVVPASKLLSETYSREKLSEILRVECSDGEGRQTKPFLNRIGMGYPGLSQDMRDVFKYFINNVLICPNKGDIPLPFSVEVLATTLNGDEKAALREITDVVRRLDIDIDGIDIDQRELAPDERVPRGTITRRSETGDRHVFQITATHQDVAGNPTQLDFIKHESAGTQRLAGLVGLVLHTLNTGGVLCVDELELSLHPLLMREIVMMFKKRRHNTQGAQLIVTTHNTDLLDDSILRISEIALVRKTKENGTLVRRLVDMKKEGEDIRNVTNFRKQYLAGFYSGIPHPSL